MKITKPKINTNDAALQKVKKSTQKPELHKLTVYIPIGLHQKLMIRKAKTGKSVSEIFTKLGEEYVKRSDA